MRGFRAAIRSVFGNTEIPVFLYFRKCGTDCLEICKSLLSIGKRIRKYRYFRISGMGLKGGRPGRVLVVSAEERGRAGEGS